MRLIKALVRTILLIFLISSILVITINLCNLPWQAFLPPIAVLFLLYFYVSDKPIGTSGTIIIQNNPDKEDCDLWVFEGIEDPDKVMNERKVTFNVVDKRATK